MVAISKETENKLWESADELRANSGLKSSEYATPVLGLIFLRFADYKFTNVEEELKNEVHENSRLGIDKTHYKAKGVLYLPEKSRFSYLLNRPEGTDMGKAVNKAMEAIEEENDELKGVLPKNYNQLENEVIITLLKLFSDIEMDMEGDIFGNIYEYFLGEFAMAEGQKGGEFFTPTSLVKLIVDVIEPYHGRIYDPACGSGGMFVQSAKFIQNHRLNPSTELSIYGQEKIAETIRLCKMNLAVHGLSGDIKPGNTYYEDVHDSYGKFDFVMANPPFNVDKVNKERIKDDKRFSYGIPRVDNANYLWIQSFISALNEKGRAGFVMANVASDARQSELEICKKIIEDKIIDVMISVSPNFFYTVTVPCTLWFVDKGKKETSRENKVLFIDAREVYHQKNRAHREFKPEHIEYISNIVRMYRSESLENMHNSEKILLEKFPEMKYMDIPGLCKAVPIEDIISQNYSLNPGRYVGIAEKEAEDYNFHEKLNSLNQELHFLNSEANKWETIISHNINQLLGDKNE